MTVLQEIESRARTLSLPEKGLDIPATLKRKFRKESRRLNLERRSAYLP